LPRTHKSNEPRTAAPPPEQGPSTIRGFGGQEYEVEAYAARNGLLSEIQSLAVKNGTEEEVEQLESRLLGQRKAALDGAKERTKASVPVPAKAPPKWKVELEKGKRTKAINIPLPESPASEDPPTTSEVSTSDKSPVPIASSPAKPSVPVMTNDPASESCWG